VRRPALGSPVATQLLRLSRRPGHPG